MKSAVIVFPGSNCDRDLAVAIEDMCRKLLANTVIENFRIERLEDA